MQNPTKELTMATHKEDELNNEGPKIPVFVVLKNGGILKNIFIVNNSSPPPPLSISNQPRSIKFVQESENPNDQENEQLLTVGRHPDCNIMLTHPSISRFHFQILSNSSLQKLSVIDLSSVHGTWVSEKKIEPWVSTELKEGDTLKVGGSNRVYKLHWIPLSQAYDFENPYVSLSDISMNEEKGEENIVIEKENVMEAQQDEIYLQMEDKGSQEIESLELEAKEEDNGNPLKEFGEENETSKLYADSSEAGSMRICLPAEEYISETRSPEFDKENYCMQPHSVTDMVKENSTRGLENESNLIIDLDSSFYMKEEEGNCAGDSVNARFQVEEYILETGSPECDVGNQCLQFHSVEDMVSEVELCESSARAENESSLIVNLDYLSSIEQKEEADCASEQPIRSLFSPFTKVLLKSEDEKVENGNQSSETFNALKSLFQEAKPENSLPEEKLSSSFNFNSTFSYGGHPAAENYAVIGAENNLPFMEESVNSSFPNVHIVSGITCDKESQVPHSLIVAVELPQTEEIESSLVKSDIRSSFPDIWSRRGIPANILQIQIDKSRRNTVVAGLDMEVIDCNQEDREDNCNLNEIFSSLDMEESEIFIPDKENLTPITVLQKSLNKKGELKEIKNLKTSKSSSSNVPLNNNIHSKEDFTGSCSKENTTLRVLQEQKCHLEKQMPFGDLAMDEQDKKRRPERLPLRSLIANSPVKYRSEVFDPHASTRSSASINYTQTFKKKGNSKSWTMIVDTASLLNKESRKSLQLLRGLKGTHLIIPRMVIRELDYLKRKGSLFRRKTEASLVLEWIEECLLKTSWWIHVQSSGEDRRLIATTPPTSPQPSCNTNSGHFCYGATNSLPFSTLWSSVEVLSPTEEDHILDCALLCRKMKNDGRLILLSNDITLKIKAMAEGLLCETIQEFRESLVNPFSERFLWENSSPRGLSWTYLDDAMLREKYNHCPFRKSAKAESARGLKLILLHNSHYRHDIPSS